MYCSINSLSNDIVKPTADYKVKHKVCKIDCNIMRNVSCDNWSDIYNPNLCEYVCDTYLDNDEITFSPTYKTIFSCVQEAYSSEDIEKCKLNCSHIIKL